MPEGWNVRVLITGITGFVGSHLAEALIARGGVEVYGTVRWRSKRDNIAHLADSVRLVECELKDPNSVARMIDEVRPGWVFHLAAQSFVPTSWNAPADTLQNNIIGQVNLLEAIRRSGIECRIQIAGSSEEYGLVYEDELPISEDNPLRPLSPYAVSKVAQDMMGYQYFKSYGLDIVRTRAFNHTGPRRGEVFVTSNFAKQIAEIEAGKRERVLEVGNLAARRDFTDVRDVVRAYILVLEMGEPGEVYQVCSGKAYSIYQVVEMLLALSSKEIKVIQDPARMRPSDVPVLQGTYEKLARATGWHPEIPFEKTLEDLLSYWRERV